jgi:hypothetical protein
MASGTSTAVGRVATVVAAFVLGTAAALPVCAAAPAKPDPRGEISGRVIDAATGAPIEGAVVIATWKIELLPNPAAIVLGLVIGGHGSSEQRTVYISEAVSDRDGRFMIPAWSPADQWQMGSLVSYSPLIKFFAHGRSPAATTLGNWTSGLGSDLSPGLRGAQLMALFLPGQTPKPDLGRGDSGLAVPTLQEETFYRLQNFHAGMEADAMEADSIGARPDSPARRRARQAQRQARELLGQELRRAYAEYSASKAQSGKDKP